MNATELRTALAAAIAEFATAERDYEHARDVSETADSDLHDAMARGESIIGPIEARSKAANAFSEAREALAQANKKAIGCANAVVEAAAGAAVLAAVCDIDNRDPDIVARRATRNALIKDSAATLAFEA
jgi:hypothetical protein